MGDHALPEARNFSVHSTVLVCIIITGEIHRTLRGSPNRPGVGKIFLFGTYQRVLQLQPEMTQKKNAAVPG